MEARIKEYETAIATSLANHNGLLGALAELKNVLTIAAPVVEALVPSASAIINTVENVVNDVDNAVEPAVSGATGAAAE
jgi:phage-related protein